MPTTADLFVRCLEAEGVPCMLGVPGEENADLAMSLEGSSIRMINTRHEQGAAFAASAYGRLTGEPLAVLATLGPGATNLLTGVADANMDHAPVLAITGQGSTDRLHKESHQIMDVVSMFEPVTKWATSIRSSKAVPETIRKAIRICRGGKPGAVLVELPEDTAGSEATGSPLKPNRYRRPVPDAQLIAEACEVLANAKRPVVLAGNGVIRTRSSSQLRAFVDALGVPVTSTFMAKGVVSRHAEQCMFTIGIQQRDEIGCLLSGADVVLAVGYDLVEYPPANWVGDNTAVIHIDVEPAEIDGDYRPGIELIGDIGAAIDAMRTRLAEGGGVQAHPHAAGVRSAMLDEFCEYADDDTQGVIKPQKLLWDTREALGPSDVLLSGVGAHKMWIGRHYQCDEPNTCLIPNGFCSMGHALPGLIGAKLARPDDRCVAICGDGDFLMNVQEMETIARLKQDVTAIVWEDKSYGLIAWKQEAEFGKHVDLSFGNPEWVGLAESFGWRGERVENSRDFGAALKRSLDHKGPSLLVAPVDYRENMRLTERLGETTCRI
ncbi:MAG: acetolactate synthase large subunit [Planctomycetota bacterium]